jgi:ribosomal protein S18 acetylase RimI-like enzyme
MLFRRATKADALAVVALIESAYRGEASRAGWTTEADLLDGQRTDVEAVIALLGDSRHRILVVDDNDGLLGTMLLTDEGDGGYIGMLAVRPVTQGRGVGRALLAEGERQCRQELGHNQVRMTVLIQRRELIAWYERQGYRRTGERVPFPYADPRSGIPRRQDLEFEVLRKTLS